MYGANLIRVPTSHPHDGRDRERKEIAIKTVNIIHSTLLVIHIRTRAIIIIIRMIIKTKQNQQKTNKQYRSREKDKD